MLFNLFGFLCLIASTLVVAEQSNYDVMRYDSPQQGGYKQNQYRWRSPEKGKDNFSVEWPLSDSSGSQTFSGYRDATETPAGLARDVYRPFQQRDKFTTHHQGFRFRPLNRSKQERINRLDRSNSLSNNSRSRNGVFPLQQQAGQFRESTIFQQRYYRFRPDTRLDAVTNPNIPLYSQEPAFTEGYPAAYPKE